MHSTAVLKLISTFCSNSDKIDVSAITCSRIQSAIQNLLEVVTEYKEVALRRDSIGSSGKSLSSSNTCRIGSYSSETAYNAECFSVQRVLTWFLQFPFIADSIAYAFNCSS